MSDIGCAAHLKHSIGFTRFVVPATEEPAAHILISKKSETYVFFAACMARRVHSSGLCVCFLWQRRQQSASISRYLSVPAGSLLGDLGCASGKSRLFSGRGERKLFQCHWKFGDAVSEQPSHVKRPGQHTCRSSICDGRLAQLGAVAHPIPITTPHGQRFWPRKKGLPEKRQTATGSVRLAARRSSVLSPLWILEINWTDVDALKDAQHLRSGLAAMSRPQAGQ